MTAHLDAYVRKRADPQPHATVPRPACAPRQIVVFFPEASKVGVKEIKDMSEKMKVRGGGGWGAGGWGGAEGLVGGGGCVGPPG